jgi:hypothetical protein
MRVLLVGWFNCKPQHLKKYTDLYNRIGVDKCDTIIYPTWKALTWTGNKSIMNYAPEKGDGKYDIVHTFSGGSLVSGLLTISPSFKLRFNKIIYDSGPMFPTADCTTNYLRVMSGLSQKDMPRLNNLLDRAWEIEGYPTKYNRYYERKMLHDTIPRMYINSSSDKYVQHDKIKDYKNGNFTALTFEDSEHVQHYRKYPKEYENSLRKFILSDY